MNPENLVLREHRKVAIESPYAVHEGDPPDQRERLDLYLRRAMRDSIERGEVPIASHRLYTDCLDDTNPDERKIGLALGYAWWEVIDEIIFYTDYGMSEGMNTALFIASNTKMTLDVRTIGKNPGDTDLELCHGKAPE